MVESRKELNNGKYIDDQMGNGVPEGGTTGQVLTKASNDDYDTTWGTGSGSGTVTSIATASPITGGTITTSGTIGITQADSTTDGYLSSTDWNTFNNKLSSVPSLQDVTDVGVTSTHEINVNGVVTPYLNIQSTSWLGNIRGDNLTSLFNRYFQLPNADGTFALSVNGNSADVYGNITIPVGGVTSVGATSPITSSGGTTPIISTSMSTNKLIGRYSSGTGVMQEVTIGSGLTLTGAGVLNNTATPTPSGYYGSWQDTVTQTAAVSNVGYPMIFRTADLENQVRVVTNGTNLTRITFDNTGIYNLQFSSQFQNVGNSEADVTIWIRKNGTDVSGSAGFVTVPKRTSAGAGNEGHTVVGWNYLLSVVAGEYYEIIWSTTNAANVTMQYYAAGSPPPSTASVIATVTQQAGIMAGTGISRGVYLVSSNTTAGTGANVDYVYLVSGTTTITLPTAIGTTNTYTIKNVGTNTVTVNTTSSQTIDGSLSASMPVQYTSLTVVSDGSNWNII